MTGPAATAPATVAELLADAARRIGGDDGWHDARLLLAEATGRSPTRLATWPDWRPDAAALQRFAAWVARRAAGEPAAHLLGRRGFWQFDLQVDARVLTPRPETEGLVEAVLAFDLPHGARVVDAGTGSGAIALALAVERPDLQLVATDRSADALAVARINGARIAPERIDWRLGHWLDPVAGPVDVLVSNPPYLDSGDALLACPPLCHEPRIALDGGPDGLDPYRELLAAAPRVLRPGGRIAFEHGAGQGAAVRALLAAAGATGIATRRDGAGHERITVATWPHAPAGAGAHPEDDDG